MINILLILLKMEQGIISMKILNGYIQNIKKQIPQYLIFICGMTHLNYSLKKLGKTFKLPKELIKTEMSHDEIDKLNWKDKKYECLPNVKNDVYVLLPHTLDIINVWNK